MPFFWAINRSQDATVVYDWFSKTGRGLDGQYRYNIGLGSDGNIRTRRARPAGDDVYAA